MAWTGQGIWNFTNGAIWIDESRLSPIYYPVQAGALSSASIAVALVAVYMAKNKTAKMLFCSGIIIIFIFGLLTTSRTNHIANAALLSLYFCLLLYHRMNEKKRLLKGLCIIVSGLLVFLGFTYVQSFGVRIFNWIKDTRGGLVSVALAEGQVALVPRDIVINDGLDGFLNNRENIWQSIFEAMGRNPSLMLWGGGDLNPMELVNELRGSQKQFYSWHAHNAWFQTLVMNGVPRFMLYLGFTIYVIRHCFKLALCKECMIWQRLLSFPVVICMLMDLVDITSFPDSGHPSVTILFLFAGMTVAYSKEQKKKKIRR